MRSKPGPGTPEMARRIADEHSYAQDVGRHSIVTRRIALGSIALTLVLEVIRWLV